MAYSFAGRYGPEIFMDASQNLMRAKPVTVYNKGTLVLATLYTDRSKTTTAANPFTTDSFGNGTFFAEPGEYDVTYGGQGHVVVVPMDPVEAQQGGPPSGTAGGDLAGTYPDPTLSAARVTEISGKLAIAGHTQNSFPAATTGTSLADLSIAASQIVARLATGNLKGCTPSEIKSLLAITQGDVSGLTSALSTLTTDVAARVTIAGHANNSIPISVSGSLADLSVGASTIVARLATGDIVAATPAQIRTLLGILVYGPVLIPGSGAGVVTINHALGSTDINTVTVKKISTGELWSMKTVVVDANNISLDFGTYARTANEFNVIVRAQ